MTLRAGSTARSPRPGPVARLRTAAALVCLAAAGCAPAPEPRPNLLLVTIDTLRADALGAYGYDRPTSPLLDAWSQGARRFEQAQATSSWTLPTLATLHTGLLPSTTHTADFASSLPLRFVTLAERLRAQGYETAAVANHTFLGVRYGLHQGFTHFDDDLVRFVADSHRAVTSEQVTERAVRFLERADAAAPLNGERPWFLWAHYFDPHDAYLAHAGFSEPFGIEDDRDLYDGEIAFTDHHLGRLLTRLEELGLDDDTLVCVVADHGEEWEERGQVGHGVTLFEEVVRVPLWLAGPGVEPGVERRPVSTLDVFPTVLRLLGLDAPDGLPGDDLLDRPERSVQLAELRLGRSAPLEAVREGDWKLVLDRTDDSAALYDLASDPDERDDVAAAHPDRVARLRAELDARMEAARAAGEPFAPLAPLELSTAEREALERLGYGGDE